MTNAAHAAAQTSVYVLWCACMLARSLACVDAPDACARVYVTLFARLENLFAPGNYGSESAICVCVCIVAYALYTVWRFVCDVSRLWCICAVRDFLH